MKFTLVWMRGSTTVGAKAFEHLAEATLYAEANLASVRDQYGATAVKVVGADGTPRFLRSVSR